MGLVGISLFGGYLANLFHGKYPEKVACTVVHDGILDLRSFYFATVMQPPQCASSDVHLAMCI